jgi:hypothetical protein
MPVSSTRWASSMGTAMQIPPAPMSWRALAAMKASSGDITRRLAACGSAARRGRSRINTVLAEIIPNMPFKPSEMGEKTVVGNNEDDECPVP